MRTNKINNTINKSKPIHFVIVQRFQSWDVFPISSLKLGVGIKMRQEKRGRNGGIRVCRGHPLVSVIKYKIGRTKKNMFNRISTYKRIRYPYLFSHFYMKSKNGLFTSEISSY